jgi:2-haloacid dehalogenase
MCAAEGRSVRPEAVIFDVGNVLYGWDPESFLVNQLADDEERLRFIEDSGFYAWHEGLDGGRPFAEAEAELSEKFPAYAELISAWGNRFGETISGPIAGSHALVEELDARGVPLFAITNFSHEFWVPFHAKEAAFFARFRDIVVSGEEKLLKPDPAIYYLALDRFGLKSADALFIDDRAINCEGAEAVGMNAHLFTTPEDLRTRLVAEGLL